MTHGGKLAARAMRDAGVGVIFTLSGGHVMPIYDGALDEGIPMIEYMHTDEVEQHFGMENTRIVGFLKSPIAKSLMDELSAHRFQ